MTNKGDDLDRRIAAQLALRQTVLAHDNARRALARAQTVRDAQIRTCLDLGVRSGDVRSIARISPTRLSQIRREYADDEEP